MSQRISKLAMTYVGSCQLVIFVQPISHTVCASRFTSIIGHEIAKVSRCTDVGKSTCHQTGEREVYRKLKLTILT